MPKKKYTRTRKKQKMLFGDEVRHLPKRVVRRLKHTFVAPRGDWERPRPKGK